MRQKLSSMLGFTMIELLVVIAIIGVLAVAVLSAINPLEQINKGRDTRTRSDAAEILSASERFFTTQEAFPWNIAFDAAVAGYGENYLVTEALSEEDFYLDPATATTATWAWIWSLASTSEVKQAFSERIVNAAPATFMFGKDSGGAMEPVYICFIPTSRQFRLEAARKCCSVANCPTDPLAGTTPAAIGDGAGIPCTTDDGTEDDLNYICLP